MEIDDIHSVLDEMDIDVPDSLLEAIVNECNVSLEREVRGLVSSIIDFMLPEDTREAQYSLEEEYVEIINDIVAETGIEIDAKEVISGMESNTEFDLTEGTLTELRNRIGY